MTFFLLSVALVAVMVAVVRPAMDANQPIPLAGFSGLHAAILFTGLTVIAFTFDPVTAAAALVALMLHELGCVLGHRLAGHDEVHFRFLPIPPSGPISRHPHDSDLTHFFVTLMGPAMGLAPMVVAFALSDLFAGHLIQHAFGTLALTLGAVNFIALLPIWPLPGGVLLQLIVRRGLPKVSVVPTAVFFAGFTGFAWSSQSPVLFAFAVITVLAYAVRPPLPAERPPLEPRHLLLVCSAYFATICAFFLGGWWVILLVTGQF